MKDFEGLDKSLYVKPINNDFTAAKPSEKVSGGGKNNWKLA